MAGLPPTLLIHSHVPLVPLHVLSFLKDGTEQFLDTVWLQLTILLFTFFTQSKNWAIVYWQHPPPIPMQH